VAARECGDNTPSAGDVRYDRAREPSDLNFERVAAIEERDDLLLDELVQCFGSESRSAARHATFVDLQLARCAEAHELVAHANAQARKVLAVTLAPLEVDRGERAILA